MGESVRRLALLGMTLAMGAQAGEMPDGFRSIFNGANIAGWHVSMTTHQGNTREWRVFDGELTGRQAPDGNGGVILTDERYRDFEVYLELKPDWGCDGGLFLRSNAAGQGYQVMFDYLEGGNVGGIYGERLRGVETTPSDGWELVWRKDDWNSVRARIEGEVPRIQVWINGRQVTDFQDTANHAAGGAKEGMIGLQVHGGSRWVKDGYHRFRNIGVKRLD